MCVEAVGGPIRSLVDWARLGLVRDGYLICHEADGSSHEVGWVHGVLAEMAQESGLTAEAVRLVWKKSQCIYGKRAW